MERVTPYGRRVVKFANGTLKDVTPSNNGPISTVYFTNGDVKRAHPGGRVEYFYKEGTRRGFPKSNHGLTRLFDYLSTRPSLKGSILHTSRVHCLPIQYAHLLKTPKPDPFLFNPSRHLAHHAPGRRGGVPLP